jgi:hypothetical protein
LRSLLRADLEAEGPAVQLGDSLENVASTLAAQRCTTARVMDDGRCVGTVSLFDVVSRLLPGSSPQTRNPEGASPVVLRFRKMGETQDMLAQFESVADAKTWLAERPQFVRVLRVEEPELPHEIEAELHDAMRPLDDEELDKISEIQRNLQQLHSVELRDLQARSEKEAAYVASTDPDRPFRVRYEKNRALEHADAGDDRPIPDAIRRAVEAWVERRNQWMHSRRQHVGAATLSISAALDADEHPADAVEVEGEIEVLAGFSDG